MKKAMILLLLTVCVLTLPSCADETEIRHGGTGGETADSPRDRPSAVTTAPLPDYTKPFPLTRPAKMRVN